MRLPRVEDFEDRLRVPEVTSRVGSVLGVAFTVCFLTGLWSHWQYGPPGWLTIPTSPAWLYRVTQGTHVLSGTVAIPLLLVKLWSVFPRLFQPPVLKPAVPALLHVLERVSILVLVSSGIFQLVVGMLNTIQWYPWSFSFRSTHYAVAWVMIGALAVHVAVKLPVIRRSFSHPVDVDEPPAASRLSRRGLLRATWVAAGLTFVLSAGQTVPLLRKVSVFGVRSGDGPLGIPINRTAAAAGVPGGSTGDAWQLELSYAGRTVTMDRADLEAMTQRTHTLPIACVEGWSASGDWTGVPLRDLVESMGAPARSRVFVTSLQTRGAFATSELPAQFVDDERTLLALRLSGEPLTLDHGYPARIIAPNRPGVLQTKWVTKLEVAG
ncbi:molybdopterin-dependent oxidoreductase [Solicola sp. PLA-1-18]|uniref:molybdopterin-dependent oxidoreductase n=1 Tax=Solicola sp. PLA-1-18 TaxID=3380532 RepID=UPI003B7AB4D4